MGVQLSGAPSLRPPDSKRWHTACPLPPQVQRVCELAGKVATLSLQVVEEQEGSSPSPEVAGGVPVHRPHRQLWLSLAPVRCGTCMYAHVATHIQ